MDAGRVVGGDVRAQDEPAREVAEVQRITVACDQETTQTTVYTGPANSHNDTTFVRFYSDVQIEGLDPAQAPVISVLGCAREAFGVGTANHCRGDFRCTDDRPDPLECVTLSFGQVGPGRLRVFCGHRQTVTLGSRDALEETVSGERWNSVRVAIL